MQVKRLLVEEKEYVMGEIESFLCRMGISYVKVENEIHCPNLILRFYDFDNFKLEIHCPNLILRFYDFDNLKLDVGELLGIINNWNPLESMIRESISDSLLVIGEEEPFQLGPHNRDFLLKAFTEFQREKFIPVSPKKAAPSPYPQPTNKKKQLQMENQRYMRKLK